MHALRSIALVSLALVLTPLAARAEQAQTTDDASARERPRWSAAASARQGLMMSELVAPGSLLAGRATLVTLSGYDSARSSMVLRSYLDANVYARFDLRAGITYLPTSANDSVQPHVGGRIRILNQARSKVDLAVGLFYRMERFTDDEGMIQGVVALGTRIQRVGLFANLTYGQDPEGDDREGQLQLAFLYEVLQALQIGFESRVRVDLASDDPKREEREDTEFDAMLTPTLSYALGPIALLAHAGASVMYTDHWKAGAIAMGGIAAAY